MTQKETASEFLNRFDLEIDFAWYYYYMREQSPTISRAEICQYYNEWTDSFSNEEWGDKYAVFPKAWQRKQAGGSTIVQIPA